ncbi:MAG: hypothetical protein APF82_08200 [Sphingomonadales bacterium BRH_c42]|nr:MAG: hypothetical protein APF82_08200 [Sphingomonadales bacterium BRH_c42]
MNCRHTSLAVALVLAAGWPSVALAGLPTGVRAMIDAAIATGDKGKIDTVLGLARATYPGDGAEIDGIVQEWSRIEAEKAAQAKQAEQQAIRSANLFERWSGKGEFGAFQSSGNSNNVGVSTALELNRGGIDWSHLLRARAEFQKSNGTTSREQYFVSYEPRYQIRDGLFSFGLAQFERNRLQGFSGRYAVSGGLGYKVLDDSDLTLSVKAGPAYRVTDFITGESESRLAGLAGVDLDWKIDESLSLSQDANIVAETGSAAQIIVDSSNTSINLVTGLDTKVSDRLKTRLSYAIDYDSNPPDGAVSTDTMTRFSLVYDF